MIRLLPQLCNYYHHHYHHLRFTLPVFFRLSDLCFVWDSLRRLLHSSIFVDVITVIVLHKEYRWIGIDHVNTEILGSDPSLNLEACVDVYLSRSSVKVVALRRTSSLSE
jgi:hypothetical protein